MGCTYNRDSSAGGAEVVIRAERLHEYESTKVVTDPKNSKPAKVKTTFEATEFLGKIVKFVP